MLWKNHVIVSVSQTVALFAVKGAFLGSSVPVLFKIARMIPWSSSVPWLNGWGCWGYTAWACACTALGAVLPDIDSRTSVVGQLLHLPLGHRTWTHCWLAVLFLFWFYKDPYTAYIFIGYVMHILQDSLSFSGICFWYPFEKYRKYPNGAKVSPYPHLRLYRTGKPSEKGAVHFLTGINGVVILHFGFYLRGFWGLPT